ncbi:MAG TPA: methyltransferase domain-containing protein [Crinalium sp.]|jgi:2-polyprenyl-3-methyl-5-hydroxy-6-metoxy-1,4-benzoquinol methylase
MSDLAFKYSGSELEIFSEAIHWKSYWGSQVRPYLGQRVLEVGAGIGGTTRNLCKKTHDFWLALEPDQAMASDLSRQAAMGYLPEFCQIQCGTIDRLEPDQPFNTILYIDVLEHIEDDLNEVERAKTLLAPGGYLVVLAPAHQWLYTAFDQAIGHYRRYNRESLLQLTPSGLNCISTRYLDSVGLLASLGNRLLLRSAQPTRQQIRLWDRYMVRLSTFIDPVVFHSVGKSILVVWQRQD